MGGFAVRVTQSMYYKNLDANNSKLNNALFDVNKQIASGQKIQYAHEGPDTFINTVRLDNEVTTFSQIQQSVQNGLKFSQQTDRTLMEMTDALTSFKTKLIQAANDTNSPESRFAIQKELEGLEQHLMTLANTSINGSYIFSGTAITEKPIDSNGNYRGNGDRIEALLGNNLHQNYNVTGSELFFGEEGTRKRTITSNVSMMNKTKLYPDIMEDAGIPRHTGTEHFISETDTIRDMIGDDDTVVDTVNAKHHFYISGTQHDGTAFKSQISMRDDETVGDLLNSIGVLYGNTSSNKVVDISLNHEGQIVIEDTIKGSSKLDFHMVAATDIDYDGIAPDRADVTDAVNGYPDATLDNLSSGTTNIDDVFTAANTLLVTEFVRSGYQPADAANVIEGLLYDRTQFAQNGAFLESEVPQIVKSDNSYATARTLLKDVASGATVAGKQLKLEGTDILGRTFDLSINLAAASTVTGTADGNAISFNIYNTASPRVAVDADEMTYRQLTDIMNLALSGELGTNPLVGATDAQYDTALAAANTVGEVSLDGKGRVTFQDLNNSTTQATVSLYDEVEAGEFGSPNGSFMTFNTNNALTVSDPKTDFFADIREAIESVSKLTNYPNGYHDDKRNIGIQNSISKLDELMLHVTKVNTEAGANSNALRNAADRTQMLQLNSEKLRSDYIDTDIAEASLQLQQLSLNYQALLSSVSRVSQLSLVNYL